MPWEVSALQEFVASGGRLLLAADPTRFAAFDPLGLSPAESAYPAVNSLANAFGIQFYDDYLYDQAENAGNYRIVRYSSFAAGTPLTSGLETLVLPAASSVQAQALRLVVGGENTRSNRRSTTTTLSPAVLAGDGRILALGDVTFLAPPFNTLEDNDHFLSNIADWLAQDERQRELRDFPLLFKGPVNLVQLLDDALDPFLIASSSPLFDLFKQNEVELAIASPDDAGGETIYVGTYAGLEAVQPILDAAGVSVNLPAEDPGAEDDASAEAETGILQVEGLGQILADGTGLFVTRREADGLKLVVLAADQDGALEMMSRLVFADFQGCTSLKDVTACAVGAAAAGFSNQPDEQTGDGGAGSGKILIISFDNRAEGAGTSAVQLERALGADYDVTVWSLREDGLPEENDLSGYDAYVVDSGDYAFLDSDMESFGALSAIEGSVMFIGEQVLPPQFFPDRPQPLEDLEAQESNHPLADGFETGQVIPLAASNSRVPALVASADSLSQADGGQVDVIFSRGPQSAGAGSPVVLAREENDQRIVLAFFAFYRLPEDLQAQFALNAAAWLVGR